MTGATSGTVGTDYLPGEPVAKRQTIQWPKNRQYNGQKTNNTMAKRQTMGATSGTVGTDYLPGEPEFTHGFSGVLVARSFAYCVVLWSN
jgi:hypothetical protein